MARLRTAERQLPPAPAARMNAAARVSCGFLFLTRSLGPPARLLSLRSVSPARQLSLSACACFFRALALSLSFFRADSPAFSHCPEQRLPRMAPAMRNLDAKATFFGRLGCKADATRI